MVFENVWESLPYNAVRLMYQSGCAFSLRTNFLMVNRVIDLIASYSLNMSAALFNFKDCH